MRYKRLLVWILSVVITSNTVLPVFATENVSEKITLDKKTVVEANVDEDTEVVAEHDESDTYNNAISTIADDVKLISVGDEFSTGTVEDIYTPYTADYYFMAEETGYYGFKGISGRYAFEGYFDEDGWTDELEIESYYKLSEDKSKIEKYYKLEANKLYNIYVAEYLDEGESLNYVLAKDENGDTAEVVSLNDGTVTLNQGEKKLYKLQVSEPTYISIKVDGSAEVEILDYNKRGGGSWSNELGGVYTITGTGTIWMVIEAYECDQEVSELVFSIPQEEEMTLGEVQYVDCGETVALSMFVEKGETYYIKLPESFMMITSWALNSYGEAIWNYEEEEFTDTDGNGNDSEWIKFTATEDMEKYQLIILAEGSGEFYLTNQEGYNEESSEKSESDEILDEISWAVDSTGTTLTISGKGIMDDYWWNQEAPWYAYRESVTKLVINEEVTSLGSNAFNEFYNLEEIYFNAAKIEEVGSSVFSQVGYDSQGVILIIGKDVKQIPNELFGGNDANLLEVIFEEDSVCESIGNGAFSYCDKLRNIVIPDSVISIGDFAFYLCNNLMIQFETLSIPKELGDHWHDGAVICTDVIKSGITEYGQRYWISSDNKAHVWKYEGEDWNVEIPEEIENAPVVEIAPSAFYSCYNLQSVSIPENVIDIGDYAFYECQSLTSILLPKNVKKLGEYSFAECTYVNHVQLDSEQLSDLENSNGVFSNLGVRTNGVVLTIGNKVKRIPSNFFLANEYNGGGEGYNIPKLKSIVFENGSICEAVGSYAFRYCSDLADVILPECITSIEEYAFGECTKLESIIIPKNVDFIGDYAFYNCTGVNSLEYNAITMQEEFGTDIFANVGTEGKELVLSIGNEVTIIPSGIFGAPTDRCFKVTKVVFEEESQCKSVESYAFYGCEYLTNITLPAEIESYEGYSFDECTSLKTAGLVGSGSNIEFSWKKEIPDRVFSGSELEKVVIPETVTRIGEYSFGNCSNLLEIVIPENVTEMGECAFQYCGGLTKIFYNAIEMSDFEGSNGIFANSGENGIEVIIGTNVTRIPSYLFDDDGWSEHVPNITSVNFEAESCCETIGEFAFADIDTLTDINIPNSVTDIGKYAFYNCSSLSEIKLSENMTRVNEGVFYNCSSATTIIIPKKLTFFSAGAFTKCTGVKKIRLEAENLETDNAYSFGSDLGINSEGVVVYVSNCVKRIPAKLFVSVDNLKEVIFEDNSICETIGAYAFENCFNLEKIVLPESITTIEEGALIFCKKIREIIIPENVKKIGNQAFAGCESLENIILNAVALEDEYEDDSNVFCKAGNAGNGIIITVGKNVKLIPAYLFTSPENTPKIVSVLFDKGSSCETIGEHAFANNESLMNIIIPDSVKDIGAYAFYNCSKLSEVVLSKNMTKVNEYVFYNCSNTGTITILNDMTDIGAYAFYNCQMNFNLPSSLGDVGERAFYGCETLTSVICKNVDSYAFYDCTNLEMVIINEGATHIGKCAFDFSGIITLEIPSSLESLCTCVIDDCHELEHIYYHGTEEEWDDMYYLGAYKHNYNCHPVWVENIHFNSYINSEGNEGTTEEQLGRVVYFGKWDAENKIAYFGDNVLGIGSIVTEETDITFIEIIDNLLGKYVYVKTKDRDDELIDHNYLISIKPVETKAGTVNNFGNEKITIDNTEYVCTVDELSLLSDLDGKYIMYHLYDGQVVGLELLECDTGYLNNYDAQDCKVKIDQSEYIISEFAQDNYKSAIEENISKRIKYYYDNRNFLYRVDSIMSEEDTTESEDCLMKRYVKEHLDYINSSQFKYEIVQGFNGELNNTLQTIKNNKEIKGYKTLDSINKVLGFDLKGISDTQEYELLLAEILFSYSGKQSVEEIYKENMAKVITDISKSIVNYVADDDIKKKLSDDLHKLGTLAIDTSEYSKKLDEFFDIAGEHYEGISKKQWLQEFNETSVGFATSVIVDEAWLVQHSFKEFVMYMAAGEAYLNTSDAFGEMLLTLRRKIAVQSNDAKFLVEGYYPDAVTEKELLIKLGVDTYPFSDPLNKPIVLSELAMAIENFYNNLEMYEKDGAKSLADNTIANLAEGTGDILVRNGSQMVLSMLQCLPVIKQYKTLQNIFATGQSLIDFATGINEREYWGSMFIRLYCIAYIHYLTVQEISGINAVWPGKEVDWGILLTDPTEDDIIAHEQFKFMKATQFDASVKFYKSILKVAIEYGRKYHKTYLDSKLISPNDKTRSVQRDIQLSKQKNVIEKIKCHQGNYKELEDNTVTYNTENLKMYIISCPVEVTVLSDNNKTIAILNDGESYIEAGYEKYLYTIKNESGDYTKIIVVPETYEIAVKGINKGTMNCYVANFIEEELTNIKGFYNIPVSENTMGYFISNSDDENDMNFIFEDKVYEGETEEELNEKGFWHSAIETQIYTGKAIKPEIKIYDGAVLLSEGKDYTLSYKNNTKPGTAQIIIKGKGNYVKTITMEFEILPKDISDDDIIIDFDHSKQNKNSQYILPTVKWGNKTLKNKQDYIVTYSENMMSPLLITARVEGKGNYTGFVENSYEISLASLDISKTIVGKIPTQYYTGEEIEPDVIVYANKNAQKNGEALMQAITYSIKYENNIAAGTGKIIIEGINSYFGKKTVTFKIEKRAISKEGINVTGADGSIIEETSYVYNGTAQKPEIVISDNGRILEEGTDYKVSYSNNTKAATVSSKNKPTITIKGIGNYTGTKKIYFNILPLDISATENFEVIVKDAKYTKKALKPSVTVKWNGKTLKNGTDYKVVKYCNNVELCEKEQENAAYVVVQGIKNFSGEVNEMFRIYEATASNFTVDKIAAYIYTPHEKIEPVINVYAGKKELLTEGEDYVITSYESNEKTGTGKIVIAGIGRYGGTKTVSFKINKRSLSTEGIYLELEESTMIYTGSSLKPEFKVMDENVELVEGVDYTVSYTNNTNVAKSKKSLPTITIKGKGNYTGILKENFAIEPKDIADESILFTVKDVLFNQKTAKSSKGHITTVTMQDGKKKLNTSSYKVTGYLNNKAVGEKTDDTSPKVVIAGIGNYKGTKEIPFRIYEKSISNVSVGKITSEFYTGKAIEPKPAVKVKISKKETMTLVEGEDYILSWDKNVNIGKGKVIITGIGEYGGNKTVTFSILPKWLKWF